MNHLCQYWGGTLSNRLAAVHPGTQTVGYSRTKQVQYMFQVPGPPPTPPAMVMVITSTPLPLVEWVGPGKGWAC